MEFQLDPKHQRLIIRVCSRTRNSLRKRGSPKEKSPTSRRRRVQFLENTRASHRSWSYITILSECFTAFTTVTNLSEVYEESEYRCLGKFADRELTYTYTERRDVFGYECFVGVIINDGELFINEAGEHCQRDVNPLRLRPSVKPNAISTRFKSQH